MATAQESLKISLDSLGLTLTDTMPTNVWNDKDRFVVRNCAPESLQKSFVYVHDNEDEDSGSIVVLGKSSLEAIRSDSLASFEQIQMKSMAMDCQSIISGLKPNEVDEKLTELLRENFKLKETLKQNSLAMKQHFTNLVNRQEELAKVHEAHRQKFMETKQLVNQLKQENNELKAKMQPKEVKIPLKQSKDRSSQTKTEEASVKSEVPTASIDNELATEMLKMAEKSKEQIKEIERLQNVISELTGQLEANCINTETKEPSLKPEVPTASIDNEFALEMLILAEKSEEQTKEIAKLQNVVSTLYRQSEANYKNFFTEINLENPRTSIESANDTHGRQFLESFTRYNDKLQTLIKCYAGQASRYITVQDCLQRCIEILSEKNFSSITDDTRESFESLKLKELQDNRKQLMDEESNITLEIQDMLQAQNDFQTMFVNYNSTIIELDKARKETERLTNLQLETDRRNKIFAETCASKTEELLAQQRRGVERERLELAANKDALEEQRIRLENEERKFVEANACINEEMIGLRETNDLLRRQCKIYEEDFADERKLFENLIAEKHNLLEELARLQVERPD